MFDAARARARGSNKAGIRDDKIQSETDVCCSVLFKILSCQDSLFLDRRTCARGCSISDYLVHSVKVTRAIAKFLFSQILSTETKSDVSESAFVSRPEKHD